MQYKSLEEEFSRRAASVDFITFKIHKVHCVMH